MKDNSFEQAMNQIVNQAKAEEQRELQEQHRQMLYARVRKVLIVGFVLAGLATAYAYRAPIQEYVVSKMPAGTQSETNTPAGGAQVTISKAAENASVRDRIVDEVSK
jgi:hypothetical protein